MVRVDVELAISWISFNTVETLSHVMMMRQDVNVEGTFFI